jgi:hypothetical protein
VIKKVLKPYHPILKLLSIKAIIGVAFWQSVIIAVLGFFEVIPSLGTLVIALFSKQLFLFSLCFTFVISACFS